MLRTMTPPKSHSLMAPKHSPRSQTTRILTARNVHGVVVTHIHVRKCPAKNAKCQFCSKDGHFEKACFKKKHRTKCKFKKQHVLETCKLELSDNEYEDDLGVKCVLIKNINSSAREVIAEVEFHTSRSRHEEPGMPHIMQGKVDTGAMVSCIPLPLLTDIGMSRQDITPSTAVLRGVSGKRLKNHGTVKLDVSCNGHQRKAKFYITGSGNELLGLNFCKGFKLVRIAETCIQRRISASIDVATHTSGPSDISNSKGVKAVHTMQESEADYAALHEKWKRYLPLSKKTRDPLGDFKKIFPDMFDGEVGLFEGEVDLKLSPNAKPVQLPPRAVPQSIMPQLKKELDKMEREGIIRPLSRGYRLGPQSCTGGKEG